MPSEASKGLLCPFGGTFLRLIIYKSRINCYFEVDNEPAEETMSKA